MGDRECTHFSCISQRPTHCTCVFQSLKNNPFPASQATTSSSNFTSGIGTEVKITSQGIRFMTDYV